MDRPAELKQPFELAPDSIDTSAVSEEVKNRYRRIFDCMLLHSKDGNVIEQEEFCEIFVDLGLNSVHEELQQLVSEMDTDGNGVIDFEEFCMIMQALGRRITSPTGMGGVGPSMQANDWRSFLWHTLTEPGFSKTSYTIALLLSLTVLLSMITLVLESVNGVASAQTFSRINMFCTATFTTDLLARVLTAPHIAALFTSLMMWLDVISILPLYAEIITGQSVGGFRVLILIRLAKLFHMNKHHPWTKMLASAFRMSLMPLLLALALALIGVLLFGSMVYYAERGQYSTGNKEWVMGEGDSWFQSALVGSYYAVITFTTVGYGDIYPRTILGKFIGSATIVVGVVLVAIPISIISINFNYLWMIMQRREAVQAESQQDLEGYLANALSSKRTMSSGVMVKRNQTACIEITEHTAVLQAIRNKEYDKINLTTDENLKHVMALIVAENRKKAWSAVRGLEVIFRDKLTAAVADRWAEWFGSNEYDPLDVAKEFAVDYTTFRQIAAKHRLLAMGRASIDMTNGQQNIRRFSAAKPPLEATTSGESIATQRKRRHTLTGRTVEVLYAVRRGSTSSTADTEEQSEQRTDPAEESHTSNAVHPIEPETPIGQTLSGLSVLSKSAPALPSLSRRHFLPKLAPGLVGTPTGGKTPKKRAPTEDLLLHDITGNE